jgi:hypothetical protein
MSGDDAGKITRAALKWVEDEGLLRQSILWQNKVREAFEAGAAFAKGSPAVPEAGVVSGEDAGKVRARQCFEQHYADLYRQLGMLTEDTFELDEIDEGGNYKDCSVNMNWPHWEAAFEAGAAFAKGSQATPLTSALQEISDIVNMPEMTAQQAKIYNIAELALEAAAQSERPGLPCGHSVECGVAYPDGSEIVCAKYRLLELESVAPQSAPGAQWISVEERLPEPNRRVMVWYCEEMKHGTKRYGVRFGEISCGHWRPDGGNGNFDDRVTHWQELPAPPGSVAPPEAEQRGLTICPMCERSVDRSGVDDKIVRIGELYYHGPCAKNWQEP